MLPRLFLTLLGVCCCFLLQAQHKKAAPLSGSWRLHYMEVDKEPVWSREDSFLLFRFACSQIGRRDVALEDSLVLIEKVRGLDPNFRRMHIHFSDNGRYEFVQVDAEDLFREPVLEQGRYQVRTREEAVVLTPDQSAPQILRYHISNGQLRLYGIDETEGYLLFDKELQ